MSLGPYAHEPMAHGPNKSNELQSGIETEKGLWTWGHPSCLKDVTANLETRVASLALQDAF